MSFIVWFKTDLRLDAAPRMLSRCVYLAIVLRGAVEPGFESSGQRLCNCTVTKMRTAPAGLSEVGRPRLDWQRSILELWLLGKPLHASQWIPFLSILGAPYSEFWETG